MEQQVRHLAGALQTPNDAVQVHLEIMLRRYRLNVFFSIHSSTQYNVPNATIQKHIVVATAKIPMTVRSLRLVLKRTVAV